VTPYSVTRHADRQLRKLPETEQRRVIRKVKDYLARPQFAKAQKAVADGVKLTTETVEKLGLARIADIDAVKQGLETLGKKLDELKVRVEGLVKKANPAAGSQEKSA
jgi:hypothetical protein